MRERSFHQDNAKDMCPFRVLSSLSSCLLQGIFECQGDEFVNDTITLALTKGDSGAENVNGTSQCRSINGEREREFGSDMKAMDDG